MYYALKSVIKLVLEAKGLSKNYLEKKALMPLNLALKKGEVFNLLRSNGTGKSTTINVPWFYHT
jgi:ABC-2 type transport system ATP-binding protein